MKRRSPFEIKLDLLAAIDQGYSGPTRIMCATNTSWYSFKKILQELVDCGYVEITEKRLKKKSPLKKYYTITKKGKETLGFTKATFKLLRSSFMEEKEE